MADPRIQLLVNVAARELPVRPTGWDRLRGELRQFCEGPAGWTEPGAEVLGVPPPEPPTEEEVRALHEDLRRMLVNVADPGVARAALLKDLHRPVVATIDVSPGIHPVGGGRSFLLVRGASWRETVLGVAALVLTRDAVPTVRRCADPNCRTLFARAGKKAFCSRGHAMRVLMRTKRAEAKEATTRRPRTQKRKKSKRRT